MWNTSLFTKWWLFNCHACPSLEPVRNPIHVRFLIQPEDSQPVARLAMLVVHDSVVSTTRVSSNPDCYEFTAPPLLSASELINEDISLRFITCIDMTLIDKGSLPNFNQIG